MTKKKFTLHILVFVLFLVSCNRNNDIESYDRNNDRNNNTDNQSSKIIPMDSISFSCKLNGQLIEFKSPNAVAYSWSKATTRLMKLKNSTKDSVLIRYSNSFINNSYEITLGFSKCFLLDVDTNSIVVKTSIVKSDLLKQGICPVQYMEQGYDYNEPLANYCGFQIEIFDLYKRINYTSYVRNRDTNIATEYSDFKSKSSFNITKLTELKGEAYKDYVSEWFFNSEFRCKLYINSSRDKTVELTDGLLNTVF